MQHPTYEYDPPPPTLREQIVTAAKSVVVVGAACSLFLGAFITALRPHWTPFAHMPEDLAAQGVKLQMLQAAFEARQDPRVLEFHGGAIVVGGRTVQQGGSVTLLALARRNISCDIVYDRIFFDVRRGVPIYTGSFNMVQAAVTPVFNPILVDLRIPLDLPAGLYSFIPSYRPKDCGLYGPFRGPLSEVFEVLPLAAP